MQPCDLSDRVSVKSLSFMAILRGHANNVVRIQDKTTETKYKGNVWKYMILYPSKIVLKRYILKVCGCKIF